MLVANYLNKTYLSLLKKKNVDYNGEYFYKENNENFLIKAYTATYNLRVCCGICELNMQPFLDVWEDSSKGLLEMCAKFIDWSICNCVEEEQDKRLIIIGVPTRLVANTGYNIEYYRWVLKTLKKFGFKAISTRYKNRNSGNTMVVLAAQYPAK